jgi:L-seryl-tRNA(Ser) seleniumtransferase
MAHPINQSFSEAHPMFRIPSGLQQIIPPAAAKKVLELLHQPALTQAVKDAAQKIGWPDMQAPGQIQEIWQQAKQWMESTLHTGHSPVPLNAAVINGTGRIFHSTLGGVPLPLGVADQAARMLSYLTTKTIEENLRETLCQQSGAEDALVVISVEHAIGLLNHLPQASDGWLVPRGDYVSWNADSHLGNCLDTSAKPSIPIGSITHCSEQDFLHGLKGTRHGVLRLSPSNAGASSTAGSLTAIDLRQVKTPHSVVHAEVLLNGTLIDLETTALPITRVASRLSSGSSMVIVPGDRFIGGPACGIILGSSSYISALREAARKLRLEVHPLLACMLQLVVTKQPDKISWQQQPVGAMLTNGVANLKDRAKRLEFQIQSSEPITSCQIVERAEAIGDYVWENCTLPGIALEIELKSFDQWSEQIQREKGVTVLGVRTGNKLTLHLRSIDPADDRLLADLFPTATETAATTGSVEE